MKNILNDSTTWGAEAVKLQANFAETIRSSTNLFDKSTITSGKYVHSASGNLIDNATYFASDFIPVSANTAYTSTSFVFAAFYNSAKSFISGLGSGSGATQTTPALTAYMKVSGLLTAINTYQVNAGSALGLFEAYGNKLLDTGLSKTVIDIIAARSVSDVRTIYDPIVYFDQLKYLAKDLNNPFIKTIIKLNGDSITSGFGGTGYSETGGAIPGTANQKNVLTATCWANMLYNLVTTKYAGLKVVDMANKNITYAVTPNSFGGGFSTAICNSYVRLNNNSTSGLSFYMYGSTCDIIYTANSTYGILDIYVDGVKVDTLDTYAASIAWSQVKTLNFTNGYHTIELRETSTKNASASGYQVQLEAIRVTKIATVINYGISGTQSVLAGASNLMHADDDYVIIMYGINDRSASDNTTILKFNLESAIKAIGTTKKIILMSSPPVSIAQEENVIYKFKAWDVDNAISNVALDFNIPFISHFRHFIEYAELKGVTIDSLQVDGLHPNDSGYKVIFDYLCKCVGLGVLRPGVTF